MKNSLLSKIVLYVLLVYFFVILLAGVEQYFEMINKTEKIIDENLTVISLVINAVIDAEMREINDLVYATKYLKKIDLVIEGQLDIFFRIYNRQGFIYYSGMSMYPDTSEFFPLSYDFGFSYLNFNGEEWRSLVSHNVDNGYFIEVFHNTAIREELKEDFFERLFWEISWMIPLIPFLIWLAVKRGLLPVKKLVKEIREREPENLKPFDISNIPMEILPVSESINNLMTRVDSSIENIRRFTSDASHELQTPLAAIKVNVEVALTSKSDTEKNKSLHAALRSVDRAAGLVKKLLDIARFNETQRLEYVETNLKTIVVEIINELIRMANQTKIEIELIAVSEQYMVKVNPEAIYILTRNLIDNAIRYSSAHSKVSVFLEKKGNEIWLTVRDRGKGIPEEDHEKVFESFFRGENLQTPGSGLGLSIVKKIAALHNTKIILISTKKKPGSLFRISLRAVAGSA